MMKYARKVSISSLAVIAVVLFSACQMSLVWDQNKHSQINMNLLISGGGTADSRLVLPTSSTVVVNLKDAGGNVKYSTTAPISGSSVSIGFNSVAFGTYTVDAKALSSSSRVEFQATSTLVVGYATSSLTLNLIPIIPDSSSAATTFPSLINSGTLSFDVALQSFQTTILPKTPGLAKSTVLLNAGSYSGMLQWYAQNATSGLSLSINRTTSSGVYMYYVRGLDSLTLLTLYNPTVSLISLNVQRADIIRLGYIQDSRFSPGTGYTLDGAQMTNTYAKLTSSSNYSSTGTYKKLISIQPTTSITSPYLNGDGANLAGVDVFFAGYFDDGNVNKFTAAELSTLEQWVRNGGTIILTAEDMNYDDIPSTFGYGVAFNDSATNYPVTRPVLGAATQQPFSGPFGTVNAAIGISHSASVGKVNIPGSAVVLGQADYVSTPPAIPTVTVQNYGSGHVVFLADIDLITNATLSTGTGVTNDNDRFLLNLFAYASEF